MYNWTIFDLIWCEIHFSVHNLHSLFVLQVFYFHIFCQQFLEHQRELFQFFKTLKRLCVVWIGICLDVVFIHINNISFCALDFVFLLYSKHIIIALNFCQKKNYSVFFHCLQLVKNSLTLNLCSVVLGSLVPNFFVFKFQSVLRCQCIIPFSVNTHSSEITATVIFIQSFNITMNCVHNKINFLLSFSLIKTFLKDAVFIRFDTNAQRKCMHMFLFLDFIVVTLNLYCKAAKNRFLVAKRRKNSKTKFYEKTRTNFRSAIKCEENSKTFTYILEFKNQNFASTHRNILTATNSISWWWKKYHDKFTAFFSCVNRFLGRIFPLL